eukprot:4967970-Pyramimonas_sp.AAC.1
MGSAASPPSRGHRRRAPRWPAPRATVVVAPSRSGCKEGGGHSSAWAEVGIPAFTPPAQPRTARSGWA